MDLTDPGGVDGSILEEDENMDNEFEQRVRERAYQIWERQGCSGDPHKHWAQAEQELAGEAIDKDKRPGERTAENKIEDKLSDFA